MPLIKDPNDTIEDTTNYILTKEMTSCWITVDNISVNIIRTDEGVVVDLYPLGLEDAGPLTSTYLFSTEAQDEIDAAKEEEEEEE